MPNSDVIFIELNCSLRSGPQVTIRTMSTIKFGSITAVSGIFSGDKPTLNFSEMLMPYCQLQEKRKLAINNARKQWEMMQNSVMMQSNHRMQQPMPDLVANHVANVPTQEFLDDVSESSRTRYLTKNVFLLLLYCFISKLSFIE